jgi:hypothetical protein
MLTLIVEARGEAEPAVAFNVTTTRFEASSGAVITANGSVRVDQPSMSAFGQHIEWKQRPPPATWTADLDGDRLKLEAVSRHEFTVRLACDRGEPSCAADGDVIETIGGAYRARLGEHASLDSDPCPTLCPRRR